MPKSAIRNFLHTPPTPPSVPAAWRCSDEPGPCHAPARHLHRPETLPAGSRTARCTVALGVTLCQCAALHPATVCLGTVSRRRTAQPPRRRAAEPGASDEHAATIAV